MGDDITIGVTEIVNNIEVTAQPNDQIIDINVTDNSDNVTLNITPTVIEINVNKGSSYARWGSILGNLTDQTDLANALILKADLVDGLVPSYQLPSYVDDVIEVANYAALPAMGETGKIYITLDTNHIYRWSGSTYIEITDNTAVWGAITGTLSSQTDLQNALNLRVPYTGATGDVNLGTYDIKSAKYWMLDEVNSNYGSMHFTDGNYHIEDADGHQLFVIEDGFVSIHKNETIQSNLYTSGLTAIRDHYLPDASGTLALTSQLHNAVTIGTANGLSLSTQVLSLGLASASTNGALSSTDWTTFNNKQNALGYTAANDANVVHLAGTETISGIKTFSNVAKFDFGTYLKQDTTTSYYTGYTTIDGFANGYTINNGDTRAAIFTLANNASRNYTFPDANGTFALTSDLSSYVPTSRTLTINGTAYDLSANRSWSVGTVTSVSGTGGYGGLTLTGSVTGSGSLTLGGTPTGTWSISVTGNAATATNADYANSSGTSLTTSAVSGTTNYIPKFTSGNTIGNSSIFDNGNIGIGITSPAEKLHVMGNSIFNNSSNNGTTLRFVSNSNSLYSDAFILSPFSNCIFSSNITYNSASGYVYDKNGYGASIRLSGGSTNNGDIFFNTFTSGTAGATATELNRMTILNNGNVGIGTTSPAAKLHVSNSGAQGIEFDATGGAQGGAYMQAYNRSTNVFTTFDFYGNTIAFQTGSGSSSSERMRITSGGNVKINNTGNGLNNAKFYVVADNGGTAGEFNVNAVTGTAIRFANAQDLGGSITLGGGGVTSYNVTSDYRLKKDFKNFNGLDLVSKIKVYDYKWNVDDTEAYGVIAHELQEVVPQCVYGEKDAKEMQQVDYSKLVPILVQAIQELKAEIEILKNK